MIPKRNINLMFQLDALLNTRTVSEAATRALITQPAMSMSLQKLRQHYKDDLLVFRNGRRHFTPLAEALRPRVRMLMRDVVETFDLSLEFDPASSTREITIRTLDVIEVLFVAPVVRRVMALAPGISVNIESAAQLGLDVASRRVELSIVPAHMADPTLVSVPYRQELMSCMVWIGHPYPGDIFDRDSYLGCKHAAMFERMDLLHPEERIDGSLLARRDVALRTANYATLASMIVGTELVVTTLAHYAQYCASIFPVKALSAPRELPEVDLVIQYPPHRRTEPLVRWLIEMFTGA